MPEYYHRCVFYLFFCFCFIYFMRERIALCFSLRQCKSVHWNWKSKISCATCKDATHHCKTTAVFLKSIWCVETRKKKNFSAFYSFLYSHTFFTCTRVAVYSAHVWRHSLHGQPERYRGLCPATILITHSQRCMGDHPLTCERGNAWEGRREHHTCGNNGRQKNSATIW